MGLSIYNEHNPAISLDLINVFTGNFEVCKLDVRYRELSYTHSLNSGKYLRYVENWSRGFFEQNPS